MGGKGSGRPMKIENIIKKNQNAYTGVSSNGFILPNLSGDHSRGKVNTTPSNDTDIPNKKYVDDSAGGAPEGTAVLSTGEGGATKFLGEDGDGTCSWKTPAGTGDVTAAVALTNETLVQGDGGAKGVKTTTVTAAEVAANTLKNTNVSTNLSAGTLTATTIDVNSSDGTNATLVEADTTNAGILGSDKWDEIVANSLKNTNVTTNITVVEAPTNVEIQSSDGTNDTIAAADVTNAGVMTTTMYDEHVVNTAHAIDNTQAHSDYLLNSGADSAVGPLTTTADNSSADTAYVPMVLYNTDAAPPAASGFPIGTLYVQYTA